MLKVQPPISVPQGISLNLIIQAEPPRAFASPFSSQPGRRYVSLVNRSTSLNDQVKVEKPRNRGFTVETQTDITPTTSLSTQTFNQSSGKDGGPSKVEDPAIKQELENEQQAHAETRAKLASYEPFARKLLSQYTMYKERSNRQNIRLTELEALDEKRRDVVNKLLKGLTKWATLAGIDTRSWWLPNPANPKDYAIALPNMKSIVEDWVEFKGSMDTAEKLIDVLSWYKNYKEMKATDIAQQGTQTDGTNTVLKRKFRPGDTEIRKSNKRLKKPIYFNPITSHATVITPPQRPDISSTEPFFTRQRKISRGRELLESQKQRRNPSRNAAFKGKYSA